MYTSKVILVLALSIAFNGCMSSAAKKHKTHVIEIKQMKFKPAMITVAPGDSVKWINRDIVAHTVFDDKSGVFESNVLQTGHDFTVSVSGNKKELQYVCTLHPVMRGQIKISDL